MANTVIDFNKIEGPVYTGRDRGTELRDALQIEALDANEASVKVIIPESTYSISSSFFLGLFGKSITRLGDKDAFYKKYEFQTSDFLKSVIDGHVLRALQERTLFS